MRFDAAGGQIVRIGDPRAAKVDTWNLVQTEYVAEQAVSGDGIDLADTSADSLNLVASGSRWYRAAFRLSCRRVIGDCGARRHHHQKDHSQKRYRPSSPKAQRSPPRSKLPPQPLHRSPRKLSLNFVLGRFGCSR